jgi:hypothetical protein
LHHSLRNRTSLILAFASLSTLAHGATTLVSSDFESDPTPAWWTTGATSSWSTAQAFSGTHSLAATDGQWVSPGVQIPPFEYYRVTARVKSDGNAGTWGFDLNPNVPYAGNGWVAVDHPFRAPDPQRAAALFFKSSPTGPVYIDDVTITQATRPEVKQSLENYYATLPAYDFRTTVRTSAQSHLPSSVSKLAAGQNLKVVMLGDSIVNDTSNGYFEALLDGQYPGQMNVVTSIRNSTGAWYYKDPAQLQSYVLQHNPDLVVIGGISHSVQGGPNNTADIASVIDQIRAYNPATEILLLTETAGNNNPFLNPSLADPVNPAGTDWRGHLYRLSQEKQTGFLDMTESWADYILASGQSYDHFLRDPVHNNARGSAVAAQTLATYFAVPEPASLSLLALPLVAATRRRRK